MSTRKHGTPQPAPSSIVFVELRGPSGRLYGRLDIQRMILEVKHKDTPKEEIDLRPLLQIKEAA